MSHKNPQARRRQRAARKAREKERRRKFYEDQRLKAATRHHGDSREYRSCLRKKRYKTKEDALATAVRSLDRGVGFLRAYECPYCGGWHLTRAESYPFKAESTQHA